jgi:hypothetical protein
LAHGIIWNGLSLPHIRDRWIAGDTKLRNESGTDPKKARIVKETGSREVIKSVGAAWRPVSMSLNDKAALAGLKPRSEEVGRSLAPELMPWIHQDRLRVGHLNGTAVDVMTKTTRNHYCKDCETNHRPFCGHRLDHIFDFASEFAVTVNC